jgi:hypothetical protein
MPSKTGAKLYIATWINHYYKAKKLEFYNNENNHLKPSKRPSKPRKRRSKSEEQFKERLVN